MDRDDDRIAALEKRVAELEARLSPDREAVERSVVDAIRTAIRRGHLALGVIR